MRRTAISLAVLLAAGVAITAPGCTRRAERRAERTYRDVFNKEEPRGAQVDLNTATQKELAKLPGITDDDAARIIAHRPYGNKRGLLNKGVIGQGKYEQIEEHVYVSHSGRYDPDKD